MLTRDSVLFYWDAMYGIDPVVGGDPIFTRDAAGWYFDGRMYRKALPGTPRIQRIHDLGEGFGPRPTLALEPGVTQEFNNPHRPGAENWSGWANTPAPSCIDHPDALANAWSVSSQFEQTSGVFSGGREMAVGVFEEGTAAFSYVYVRDETAANWVVQARVTWGSNPAIGVAFGGADANAEAGAITLAERGPNGGRLVLLWVRFTAPAGNSRKLRCYPTGATTSTAWVHYLGACETADAWTPFVGDAGASTVFDGMYFDAAPPPQATIIYADFVVRAYDTNLPRLIQFGSEDGANPRMLLYRTASNQFTAFQHNGTSGASVSAALSGLTYGDRVGLALITKDDGAIRIAGRRNGGSVVASVFTGPSAFASEWHQPAIRLGAQSSAGGNPDSTDIARAFAVRAGDLAAGVVGSGGDILNELADFYLGPNGEVL